MDDRVNDASDREQRLDELATAYLKAQEAGQTRIVRRCWTATPIWLRSCASSSPTRIA
jgi:hypothetical protein